MEWPDAENLPAGPHGRRLCWSLLDPGDYPGWDRVGDGASAGDLTGLTDELAACVARTDLDSLVTQTAEVTLEADICQITVEPGINITAPRTTGSDIRRHKASNYSPEVPPGVT